MGFVWALFIAYMSDRFDRRGLFLCLTVPLGIVAYAILIGTQPTALNARYAALFLIVIAMCG